MDKKKMVEMLNKALTMEHACSIRYMTHAAVVTGPYAEPMATRLKEIGQDEAGHAEKLRDRVVALGGTPTLEVERAEGTAKACQERSCEKNLLLRREIKHSHEAPLATQKCA